MNCSYYKILIVVHDGMPSEPIWIQIERNSFLILLDAFLILKNEFLIFNLLK